jgi:hypothetical protein
VGDQRRNGGAVHPGEQLPAVLVLKPFIDALKHHDTAWLVIAMASTLAGNFTVLGSIANLIVVQRAAASGVTIPPTSPRRPRLGLPNNLSAASNSPSHPSMVQKSPQ